MTMAERPDEPPRFSREDRQRRIEDLERWIYEQEQAFADEAFPEDVRERWDANNGELEEHRRVMAELEERERRVNQLASRDGNREPGGQERVLPRPGGGPQLISRMSERDVYDMSTVRASLYNEGDLHQQLRDRAMRSVEMSHFPDMIEREDAQKHVQRLLDTRDAEDSPIAKRVLLTGAPSYRTAFAKTLDSMLKHGTMPMTLTHEEQRQMEAVRAMSVGTGSAGGFAVPYTLDPTVIPTSNLSVNPYRAICRVEQITVLQWLGVTSSGVTASYATEAAPASDNSPTLAQPSMNMVRAQCFVPVSIELTQDWGALQSELANLIQDAKDDLEATKFTTGSGTNEPTGLITGATTLVNTAAVATFAVGDVYALEQALGPRFRPRGQMIANRTIWNKVRQFDTSGGAGLWMFLPAGLDNQVPRGGNLGAQVLGYGANEASAMATTTTTGSKIVVFGDPRYYIIVDRIGMDIEVIPHIFQTVTGSNPQNVVPLGQRGFYAFWRNNARVLDVNAFRVLNVA